MGIKRLDWDSNFFGFEVGEIFNTANLEESKNYSLIVLKQNEDKDVQIENFEKKFQETKVIFNRMLHSRNRYTLCNNIIDFDKLQVAPNSLYPLAFESGKNSRFKLDSNIGIEKFELLYTKWIDNSIIKQYADKVFYVNKLKETIGLVTVKLSPDFATIGLIAVSEKHQGKGIGKDLIYKVEEYCISQNIFQLKIPTQKENKLACLFYSGLGYSILEENIIKHFWNINK